MPTSLTRIAACWLLLAAARCTDAQTGGATRQGLSFHPAVTWTLGSGLDYVNLAEAKLSCVSGTRSDLAGVISTNAYVSVAKTASELRSSVGFDAEVDASYLAFSGNASYSYKSDFLQREDTLAVVLRAATEYGGAELKDVVLTEQALKWLDNPADREHFRTACGTYYVSSVRMGASVSVILALSGLTREEKEAISGELGASGSGGAWSASGSAKSSQTISKIFQSGRATMQVVATGDSGLAALKDLLPATVAKPDSLNEVVTALQSYVAGFDRKNAAPLAFSVTPIRLLDTRIAVKDLSESVRLRRMARLVDAYRTRSDELALIDQLLANDAGPDHRLGLTSEELQARRVTVENELDDIEIAHSACRDGAQPVASCAMPANLAATRNSLLPKQPRISFEIQSGNAVLTRGETMSVLHMGTAYPGATCAGDPSERTCKTPFGGFASAVMRSVRQLVPNADDAQWVLRIDGSQIDTISLWVRRPEEITIDSVTRTFPEQVQQLALLPVNGSPPMLPRTDDAIRFTMVWLADAARTFEGTDGVPSRPHVGLTMWHTRTPMVNMPGESTFFLKIIDALGVTYYADIVKFNAHVNGPGIFGNQVTLLSPILRGETSESERKEAYDAKVKASPPMIR